MDYFFALGGQAPQQLWIPVFSRTHVVWLAAAALFCAAVTFWFSKRSESIKNIVLKCCIWAAIASRISSNVWMMIAGEYSVQTMLPLHLCGVMLYVELAAVYTKKPILLELCYCLGLPSAVNALITPGITNLPMWNLMYLQFILAHTMLFLIPVLFLADGFRPNYHQLPKCYLALLLLAVFDSLTNFILNSNYLFLRWASPQSLLEGIEQLAGRFYLPAVMVFVWLVWAALYLPRPAVKKIHSFLQGRRTPTARPTAAAESFTNRLAVFGYVRKIVHAARLRLHS